MINTHEFTQDGVAISIPFDEDVMVNATKVYKSFNIPDSSFASFKKRTLIPIAERMAQLSNNQPNSQNEVSVNDLIVVRKGGDEKDFQGTWLHPRLAIVFARWISIDFGIWCDDKILELLKNGAVGATEEINEDLKATFLTKSIAVKKYIRGKGFSQGNQVANIVMDLVKSAELAGVPFNEVLKVGVRAAGPKRRDKFLDKVIRALKKAVGEGSISTGSYIDKVEATEKFQKQALRRRVTSISNKYNKTLMEIEVLKLALDEYVDAAVNSVNPSNDTANRILELTDEIAALNQKLQLYADEEEIPPVDLVIRPSTALTDLQNINNKIKTAGCSTVFSGVIGINKYADTPGKNGKKRPTFIGSTVDSNDIAIWPTEGVNNYTISISNKTSAGGFAFVFKSVLLSKSSLCNSLYLGYHVTSDGNRYYIGFETVTCSLVIYRV